MRSLKKQEKQHYYKNIYIQGGWLDADVLGCFKLLDTAVNLSWVEAQQKCETIGGYLAEPITARLVEITP
jgi:hypothetical protein